MPKLLAKAYVENIEKINEEDGTLEAAVASTPIVDREGEVIEQEGWKLKDFKKNPVLLWAHNIGGFASGIRPPIGKVLKIWIEGSGKKAKLMFVPKFDLKDFFARDIFRKFKDGYLNAFSVGFIPIEQEENIYKEVELLEISAVPVPANPQAAARLRSTGFETRGWEGMSKEKEDPDFEDIANQALLRDQVEEKPYPGEHACRLEDPKQFDRFARKNCEQKSDGKCIDVIYGIKEGKSKIQSLRYKRSAGWTPDGARSHCKGRGGSFEAASTSQEEIDVKVELPELAEIKKELEYIKARMNQIVGEVRASKKKEKMKAEDLDLSPFRDALKIVAQASNIILQKLKEEKLKAKPSPKQEAEAE